MSPAQQAKELDLAVGDAIEAHMPGVQIALTRTAEHYRVVVLDCYGQPLDKAWNKNFDNEGEARFWARAATIAHRPRQAAIRTVITHAAAVAA